MADQLSLTDISTQMADALSRVDFARFLHLARDPRVIKVFREPNSFNTDPARISTNSYVFIKDEETSQEVNFDRFPLSMLGAHMLRAQTPDAEQKFLEFTRAYFDTGFTLSTQELNTIGSSLHLKPLINSEWIRCLAENGIPVSGEFALGLLDRAKNTGDVGTVKRLLEDGRLELASALNGKDGSSLLSGSRTILSNFGYEYFGHVGVDVGVQILEQYVNAGVKANPRDLESLCENGFIDKGGARPVDTEEFARVVNKLLPEGAVAGEYLLAYCGIAEITADVSKVTISGDERLLYGMDAGSIKLAEKVNGLTKLLDGGADSTQFFTPDKDNYNRFHQLAQSVFLEPWLFGTFQKHAPAGLLDQQTLLERKTPLMFAAAKGEPKLVDGFIGARADVTKTDINGKTALDIARDTKTIMESVITKRKKGAGTFDLSEEEQAVDRGYFEEDHRNKVVKGLEDVIRSLERKTREVAAALTTPPPPAPSPAAPARSDQQEVILECSDPAKIEVMLIGIKRVFPHSPIRIVATGIDASQQQQQQQQ